MIELFGLIVEKLLMSVFLSLICSPIEVQVKGPDFILVFDISALEIFLLLNPPPALGDITLDPGYLCVTKSFTEILRFLKWAVETPDSLVINAKSDLFWFKSKLLLAFLVVMGSWYRSSSETILMFITFKGIANPVADFGELIVSLRCLKVPAPADILLCF